MDEVSLQDYICFGLPPEPEKAIIVKEMDGEYICLLVPFKEWPRALFKRHRQDLLYLFRSEFHPVPDRTLNATVSLCADIVSCGQKCGGGEFRQCPHHSAGICIPATLDAHGGKPIRLGVFAPIHGVSRGWASQMFKQNTVSLRCFLLEDPENREILEAIADGRLSVNDLINVGLKEMDEEADEDAREKEIHTSELPEDEADVEEAA